MTGVPEIVLFDVANSVAAADNMLFGPNAPVLIDPHEAIKWIATGKLSDALGPLRWTDVVEDTLSSGFERAEGRYELAEEIVVSAVMSGRVRCAFVTEDQKGLPRLSYVDPNIFEQPDISHGWDEGLYLQLFESSEDDARHITIEKFWFFWSDILALAPRRASDDAEPSDLPSDTLRPPLGGAGPQLVEGPSRQIAIAHDPSRDTHSRRGRGRPAGKNGEPIAMFVLRVQAEGVEAVNAYTDDALGAMLKEEYDRLRLPAPENTNAARDARGVLRALVKMRVKIEGDLAE